MSEKLSSAQQAKELSKMLVACDVAAAQLVVLCQQLEAAFPNAVQPDSSAEFFKTHWNQRRDVIIDHIEKLKSHANS